MIRKLKSCGVLCFRHKPVRSFLLMKHPHRLDLPKGHMNEGETEIECALRELHEETGIPGENVELNKSFRFVTTYHPRYKRFGGERVEKTVVVFLGWLKTDAVVEPTEHQSYEWTEWRPPHHIWSKTIDPLLAAVQRFLEREQHSAEA